jgi:hypothetical protein
MLALYDEFDTYWKNGGYKKISDIIFAEWHIFIVSNPGFKIKISNFETFVGFFVYVNFLPAVFIFDNESVSVRR